jgi:hypothetical protein
VVCWVGLARMQMLWPTGIERQATPSARGRTRRALGKLAADHYASYPALPLTTRMPEKSSDGMRTGGTAGTCITESNHLTGTRRAWFLLPSVV